METSAAVEDRLERNDEQYDERIHIRMGMKRVPPPGKKDPLAYADDTTPAYTQFRRGKDDDWAGKRTSTVKNPGGASRPRVMRRRRESWTSTT